MKITFPKLYFHLKYFGKCHVESHFYLEPEIFSADKSGTVMFWSVSNFNDPSKNSQWSVVHLRDYLQILLQRFSELKWINFFMMEVPII